jgi:hypothetical protein
MVADQESLFFCISTLRFVREPYGYPKLSGVANERELRNLWIHSRSHKCIAAIVIPRYASGFQKKLRDFRKSYFSDETSLKLFTISITRLAT